MKENKTNKIAGLLGLSGVLIFSISLLALGYLNADFSFVNDFISKLGAKGEPNAIWWNLIGFVLVGITLTGFGILYGRILKDKLVGILLSLFGVGFAFTSIPIDMVESDTSISKAHIVAITLALASWLLGLAKISSNYLVEKYIRDRANIAAILVVFAMIGFVINLWSMPITHRFVFLVVFGWVAITSISLLSGNHKTFSN